MSGTRESAWTMAAAKLGLSLDEYTARRRRGLRWCTECEAWRTEAEFAGRHNRCPDTRRHDEVSRNHLLARLLVK